MNSHSTVRLSVLHKSSNFCMKAHSEFERFLREKVGQLLPV